MTAKAKGYTLGAIAAATYGMNPLFALPLYADGMNSNSVLIFRYLLAIPLLAFMVRVRRQRFAVPKKTLLPLIAMGLLMAFSSFFLFESYTYMNAGIASTILFVYPIMVAVIMALVFKERITLQTACCILLALAGIAMLYKNETGATLSLTGTMFVLGSALSYAIYIVGANRPKMRSIPTVTITFYVLLFGVLFFAERLLSGTQLTFPSKWYLWVNLLALAVFPTAISFLCTTSAIQYIGSTPTAILGALEPVTAIFFSITVFGEMLTLRETTGILMILFAVTFVIAGGNITAYMVRFRKLFPKLPFKPRRQ